MDRTVEVEEMVIGSIVGVLIVDNSFDVRMHIGCILYA